MSNDRTEITTVTICVIAGPDAGLQRRCYGRAVLGTHPSADVVLTDPEVSPLHCEITAGGRGAVLRDLESRRGTRVQNLAIGSARIKGPVVVRIGGTEVSVEPNAESRPGGPAGGLPVIDPSQPIRAAREAWVHYFERAYLARLLEQTGQNVSAAARVARIDRVHMHRLLSRAGLR